MQRSRVIKGKADAKPDTFVSMFGVMSGLTYGKVKPLFAWMDKAYESYIFFVQLTDEFGNEITGTFGAQGDSGSVILDGNGYVLGMFIGDVQSPEPKNRLGVGTRFPQIEAALDVKLSSQA